MYKSKKRPLTASHSERPPGFSDDRAFGERLTGSGWRRPRSRRWGDAINTMMRMTYLHKILFALSGRKRRGGYKVFFVNLGFCGTIILRDLLLNRVISDQSQLGERGVINLCGIVYKIRPVFFMQRIRLLCYNIYYKLLNLGVLTLSIRSVLSKKERGVRH